MATNGREPVYVVEDEDAEDFASSRSLNRLDLSEGVARGLGILAFDLSKEAVSPAGDRFLVVKARHAPPAPVPETSIWIAGDGEAQITPWGFFYDALGWLSDDVVVYSQAKTGTPPCEWTTFSWSLAADSALELGQGRAVAISPDGASVAVVDDQRCNASQSLHILDIADRSSRDVDATDSYIHAVSWSPSGSYVAASAGSEFKVYEASSGAVIARHSPVAGYASDSAWIDERTVVFGNGRIRALDIETGLVTDVAPGGTFLHIGRP